MAETGGASRRIAAEVADEGRLGALLEGAYAARAAHITPPDGALARLDATLDRAEARARRRAGNPRLRALGACAALILILSSVGLSQLVTGARHPTQSAAAPTGRATGGGGTAIVSDGGAVAPPVAVAATEGGRGIAPPATTGDGGTPLRDLLARAGIRASDPPSASGP